VFLWAGLAISTMTDAVRESPVYFGWLLAMGEEGSRMKSSVFCGSGWVFCILNYYYYAWRGPVVVYEQCVLFSQTM
jgi:hypothetical protein